MTKEWECCTMYFLSALVNLTLAGAVPTHGWIQDDISYETQEECQADISDRFMEVHYSVHQWFHGLGSIDQIACITHEEFKKLNLELGHKKPSQNNI